MPPRREPGQRPESHMEKMADKMMKMGIDGGTDTFIERLAKRLEREKVALPSVMIQYEHINVETDAFAGSAAMPSLYNTAKNITVV